MALKTSLRTPIDIVTPDSELLTPLCATPSSHHQAHSLDLFRAVQPPRNDPGSFAGQTSFPLVIFGVCPLSLQFYIAFSPPGGETCKQHRPAQLCFEQTKPNITIRSCAAEADTSPVGLQSGHYWFQTAFVLADRLRRSAARVEMKVSRP